MFWNADFVLEHTDSHRYLFLFRHPASNRLSFPRKPSATWLKVCLRERRLSSRLRMGQHRIDCQCSRWRTAQICTSFSGECPNTFDHIMYVLLTYWYKEIVKVELLGSTLAANRRDLSSSRSLSYQANTGIVPSSWVLYGSFPHTSLYLILPWAIHY